MAGYILRWFIHPQTVTHPSINPRRAPTLINADVLPLSRVLSVDDHCHMSLCRCVSYVPCVDLERCRITPPRFLAECRMRRLNQGSFDLLYFTLFAFSGLCLVFSFRSVSVFNLFYVLYSPAYTNVNGTV